jgi:hypothetical protein
MFGAVRGSPSRVSAAASVETVPAAARTVKLRTNYFLTENSVPSALRPLDFLGHKEVRRLRDLCHYATTNLDGQKDNVRYCGIGDTLAHRFRYDDCHAPVNQTED